MVVVKLEGIQYSSVNPISGGRNLERRFKIKWNKNQRYYYISNCN
jgi:hypothetical protein